MLARHTVRVARLRPWARCMTDVVVPDVPMTHEVFNQPGLLEDFNLLDTPLREAVGSYGAGWAAPALEEFGALMGSRQYVELGQLANANPPILHNFDHGGNRVDVIQYHPAYHELFRTAFQHGVHCLPYTATETGRYVARSALMYMMYQVESGVTCPLSMTFAGTPIVKSQPELADMWYPGLTSRTYDPTNAPAHQKRGLTLGMSMTEKQGGSDVRANTTKAEPLESSAGPGKQYKITGHKWFTSAPMCDGFLTLAGTEAGTSCFLVPRWLPDGTRNRGFMVQRLKDKLGDRSNASSEVEYRNAWGIMVGEEGAGIKTIMDMVMRTRLDCAVGSAALMRFAVTNAVNHCTQRSAFGAPLVRQPLMQNVLADLAVEAEAGLLSAMRLSLAFDEGETNPEAKMFARVAAAVSKYWLCKRAPLAVVEGMECFGGSGYVESSRMPRAFRQSPLNSIWEGSGNVICLDLLRIAVKEPQALKLFVDELTQTKGMDPRYDVFLNRTKKELGNSEHLQLRSRLLMSMLARAMQANLLLRYGKPEVAEAYLASRLDGTSDGALFGALPQHVQFASIIDRAAPRR